MVKKLRLWKCPKCLRCWTRHKGERYCHCSICDRACVKATKYPDHAKVERIRKRERVKTGKELAAKNRLLSVARDRGKRVLALSTATRRAWQGVKRAKSIEVLAKRADIWLKALAHDVRDVKGSHGGMVGLPQLVFAYTTADPCQHGEYLRSILRGHYGIEVVIRQGNYEQAQQTLLHEALHWVDDESNIDRAFRSFESHDRFWEKRLARFTKDMNIKPRGA